MPKTRRRPVAGEPSTHREKAQIPLSTPDGERRRRHVLPSGEPVPEVIPPRSAATRDSLPVPRGAVKVLGRLLVMSQGNPLEAAMVARRWACGSDEPRYALLAGILDEIAAESADLLKAGAVPA